MFVSVLVGCVAGYYFGLRAGAWAAAATCVVELAAFFFPRHATALHVVIAVALVAMWRIGSRRPIPPDSALAVRWLRRGVKRLVAWIRAR